MAPKLIRAVKRGKDAETIREMIEGMTQEEVEATDRRRMTALHHALHKDTALFKVVLKAMSTDAIDLSYENGCCVLYEALRTGKKEAVLLLVKRMKKERKWKPFASMGNMFMDDGELYGESMFYALCDGPLIADRQMVDMVAKYVPKRLFLATPMADEMLPVVKSKESDITYAMKVCCRKGSSMEERASWLSSHRMQYVACAARHSDLARVKMMHDLVPLLKDKSGRRAAPESYAKAINEAGDNEDAINIIEYLMEQGGAESLQLCAYDILWKGRSVRLTKFLVRQAPSLLTQVFKERIPCTQEDIMANFCSLRPESMKYLVRKIGEQVESGQIGREELARLLRQLGNLNMSWRASRYTAGWAKRLDPLWSIVPEALTLVRFSLLMTTIEHRQVEDADYILAHCTQDDLARRQKGSTPKEWALEHGFPEEMVARMSRLTKNANSETAVDDSLTAALALQ